MQQTAAQGSNARPVQQMEARMQLAFPPSQSATVSMPGITCCACVSKSNKKPCHHAKVYRSVMARQMFDFALLLPYGLGSNRCFNFCCPSAQSKLGI